MGTEPCDVTDQTLLRRVRSQEHFSADGRKVYCARCLDAKLKGLIFGEWHRMRRAAASGAAAVYMGDTFLGYREEIPPCEVEVVQAVCALLATHRVHLVTSLLT